MMAKFNRKVVLRVQWLHIVIPFVTGALTGLTTYASAWIDVSEPLLSVVAIVSAAVLVRLARGAPFTAIEVLDAAEAQKLSIAIKQSVRSQGGLLLACIIASLCLVFIRQINDIFSSEALKEILPLTEHFDYLACLVPLMLAFVFMRTYAIVIGDIQIADLQADILLKKRNREAAEDFRKKHMDPAKKSFQAPEGYGRVAEEDHG